MWLREEGERSEEKGMLPSFVLDGKNLGELYPRHLNWSCFSGN